MGTLVIGSGGPKERRALYNVPEADAMRRATSDDVKYFDLLFQPWIGAADDDELMESFSGVSMETGDIVCLLRKWIAPVFCSRHRSVRIAIMAWIRTVRDLDACDFVRLWESILPPFDLPEDVRGFIEKTEMVLAECI